MGTFQVRRSFNCFIFICFWKEIEISIGQQCHTMVGVGGKASCCKPEKKHKNGPLITET